jgi:penicillin-binding protein 1C
LIDCLFQVPWIPHLWIGKSRTTARQAHSSSAICAHLLAELILTIKSESAEHAVIKSTLDKDLQIRVTDIVTRYHEELKGNGINNAAALVADVETGNVLLM